MVDEHLYHLDAATAENCLMSQAGPSGTAAPFSNSGFSPTVAIPMLTWSVPEADLA